MDAHPPLHAVPRHQYQTCWETRINTVLELWSNFTKCLKLDSFFTRPPNHQFCGLQIRTRRLIDVELSCQSCVDYKETDIRGRALHVRRTYVTVRMYVQVLWRRPTTGGRDSRKYEIYIRANLSSISIRN